MQPFNISNKKYSLKNVPFQSLNQNGNAVGGERCGGCGRLIIDRDEDIVVRNKETKRKTRYTNVFRIAEQKSLKSLVCPYFAKIKKIKKKQKPGPGFASKFRPFYFVFYFFFAVDVVRYLRWRTFFRCGIKNKN